MIQFTDPVEAYIAILFAVTAVDGDLNPSEFQTSHTSLDNLPAFKKYDDDTIANFWIDMTGIFFDEFSSDGLSLNQAQDLIGAIKVVLPADQYETAYTVAVETAYADGLGEREQQFLSQLRTGLGISQDQAQAIADKFAKQAAG